MAEQKPAQQQAKKEEPAPAPAVLGSAGASSNPLVHDLLAHRAIAVSNGDDDAVKAVDKQLAGLGVSVD